MHNVWIFMLETSCSRDIWSSILRHFIPQRVYVSEFCEKAICQRMPSIFWHIGLIVSCQTRICVILIGPHYDVCVYVETHAGRHAHYSVAG